MTDPDQLFKLLEETTLQFQEYLPVALCKIEVELEGYKFVIPSGTKKDLLVQPPNCESILKFSDLSIVHRLKVFNSEIHRQLIEKIEMSNAEILESIKVVCNRFLTYIENLE